MQTEMERMVEWMRITNKSALRIRIFESFGGVTDEVIDAELKHLRAFQTTLDRPISREVAKTALELFFFGFKAHETIQKWGK